VTATARPGHTKSDLSTGICATRVIADADPLENNDFLKDVVARRATSYRIYPLASMSKLWHHLLDIKEKFNPTVGKGLQRSAYNGNIYGR